MNRVGRVVEAIELRPKWLEDEKDEVVRVKDERAKVQERLRRMAKAYVDHLSDDDEYHRQKRLLEMELESLVVPQANAAEEAGKLVQDLPRLWAGASLEERRKLLLTMLDAVYVDAKDEKRIVAIKPKPPFWPVFRVTITKEGLRPRVVQEYCNPGDFRVRVDRLQPPPAYRVGNAPSPVVQV